MADYIELVDRFIKVSREHLHASLSIGELCRIAGLHHRTLLRAFWAVHRTTPYRYLHALRLDEARQMLSQGTTNSDTVTQVAMRFGFRELGRFAADYRAAFGESPSQTLRSASAAGNIKRATTPIINNGSVS